jgi:hypothetical protein
MDRAVGCSFTRGSLNTVSLYYPSGAISSRVLSHTAHGVVDFIAGVAFRAELLAEDDEVHRGLLTTYERAAACAADHFWEAWPAADDERHTLEHLHALYENRGTARPVRADQLTGTTRPRDMRAAGAPGQPPA